MFDSVDHEVLVQNLYHFGVRGTFHKLVANYSADRFQYDKSSVRKSTKSGVPQGSVLGP